MVSIDNLTVEFGGNALLDNISFLINEKEKIALTGRNGAGKTTLLRLIAGKSVPSSGVVSKPKGLTIGYLPQHLTVNDTKTVFEETLTAFENIFLLKQNIGKLTQELEAYEDCNSDKYNKLIETLDYENERLRMFGSQNMEAETEKTLIGLGSIDFENRKRICLARHRRVRKTHYTEDKGNPHLQPEQSYGLYLHQRRVIQDT